MVYGSSPTCPENTRATGVRLALALLTVRFDWNVWAAMAFALALALAIGFVNGFLVVRTKLPSFIITLGTFLMLQGINLGVTKYFTNTVSVGGIDEAPGYQAASAIFAQSITIFGTEFRIAILWWIGVTAVATWVLLRTRLGNWIFAVGGDAASARAVGALLMRVTLGLAGRRPEQVSTPRRG